jgi:hypothetical protein
VAGESSKAVKQKHADVLAISSMATASAPPSLMGVGLTTCMYNDTRSSA